MDIDLHLSLFDFIIVSVLIWGIYKGYLQGYIVQTIALFALLAGTYIAAKLSMGFYNLMVDRSETAIPNLPVVVFSVLFGFVLFASNYVALYILKQVASVPKDMYAKFLGSFFAMVKYLVIISVFLVFIKRIDNNYGIVTEREKERTLLFQPVSKLAPTIIPTLKFEVREPVPEELEDITFETE